MKKLLLIILILIISKSYTQEKAIKDKDSTTHQKEQQTTTMKQETLTDSIYSSVLHMLNNNNNWKSFEKRLSKSMTKQNLEFLLKELSEKTDLSKKTINELSKNMEDSEKKATSQKIIEEFVKKLEESANIKDAENIGTFTLFKSDSVRIWEQTSYTPHQNDKPYKPSNTNDVHSSFGIEEVYFHIKDGVIFDIRVFTDKPNLFFTNTSPTNIRSFHKKHNVIVRSNQDNDLYLRLSDFISYHPANGKRYMIDNHAFALTSKDSIHQVKIKNNLKSYIDFRVYSDFLGLIDESSNGIVSFEGNSTFYLNPFNLGRFNYIFKKFKTGIRYSRFDNDDRTIQIPFTDTLGIIQKSFLNIGSEVDVYEVRLGKKFPYKILAKAKGTLDITEISEENSEKKDNSTTLGLSFGAEVQVERSNKFGINTSFYFNRYQNNNIVENDVLNFNTFSIHSEAYFYTSDNNDAFFLRLKYEQGRRSLSTRSNFFNVQFGYKAELNFQSKK